MLLNQGTQLQNGKYRIIRVLGQGGFGITYLAENMISRNYMAIKEFFPNNMCRRESSGNIEVLSSSSLQIWSKLKYKFQKEAKHLSTLNHPNIIKMHEVFDENNTVYYSMDYIDGLSLLDKLRSATIDRTDAIQYILKIADALSHVHKAHITHLDIKPGNIMIRKRDNEPILIDFGLSKHYDSMGLATTSLAGGFSIGYSPIEQLEGRIAEFSPQTDIYAIGATLYSVLTNQAPPFATTLRNKKLEFTPNVTIDLQNVINKAMSYEISQRYCDMRSFYLALKRCYSHISYAISDTYHNNEETVGITAEIVNTSSIPKINDRSITIKKRNNASKTKSTQESKVEDIKPKINHTQSKDLPTYIQVIIIILAIPLSIFSMYLLIVSKIFAWMNPFIGITIIIILPLYFWLFVLHYFFGLFFKNKN